MIQITPHMRIFVALTPADFRCQIDGLSAICREVFQEDPLSGAVFVFRNRSASAIKLLFYDGDGYWLCHRRLARGRLRWWPSGAERAKDIDANELVVLLWNGDPRGVFREPWKRLPRARLDEQQGKQEKDAGATFARRDEGAH